MRKRQASKGLLNRFMFYICLRFIYVKYVKLQVLPSFPDNPLLQVFQLKILLAEQERGYILQDIQITR